MRRPAGDATAGSFGWGGIREGLWAGEKAPPARLKPAPAAPASLSGSPRMAATTASAEGPMRRTGVGDATLAPAPVTSRLTAVFWDLNDAMRSSNSRSTVRETARRVPMSRAWPAFREDAAGREPTGREEREAVCRSGGGAGVATGAPPSAAVPRGGGSGSSAPALGGTEVPPVRSRFCCSSVAKLVRLPAPGATALAPVARPATPLPSALRHIAGAGGQL